MTFFQTQTEHIKKAKKTHRCDWCWEAILPGEDYYRWRFFGRYEDIEAGTCKVHPECFQALGNTPAEEIRDGWTPGQFERGQPA